MKEKIIQENKINELDKLRIKQFALKYLSSTSTLSLTALFTPNFNISSFPPLILFAFLVVVLDYLVSTTSGIHDIPIYRVIVGFVSCAVILYMTQFFVSGFYISLLSTLIAALIYGIIEYFIPNREN